MTELELGLLAGALVVIFAGMLQAYVSARRAKSIHVTDTGQDMFDSPLFNCANPAVAVGSEGDRVTLPYVMGEPKSSKFILNNLDELEKEISSLGEDTEPSGIHRFMSDIIFIRFRQAIDGNYFANVCRQCFASSNRYLVRAYAFCIEQKSWISLENVTGMQRITNVCFELSLAQHRICLSLEEVALFRKDLEQLVSDKPNNISFDSLDLVGEKISNLSRLVDDFDIQIALTFLMAQRIDFAILHELACQHGLTSVGKNCFIAYDAKQRPVFTVLCSEQGNCLDHTLSISNVLLMIDVPSTPNAEEAVDALLAFSQAMKSIFMGSLVDDAGHPLTGSDFIAIKNEIISLHKQMAENGLEAGSDLVQGLFV